MSRLPYLCMLLPLLIPTAVFSYCGLTEGLSLTETWTAVWEQYATRRQNLLVCGLLGVFPVLLLLIGLWIHRRFGGSKETRQWMAWGGLIPILLVSIWANLQFWPLFLPDRIYPGFPHGLELLIGPVFFAPVGMVLGMGGAWWAARKQP